MQQEKKISCLDYVEKYLRKYPTPTSIEFYQGLFKLTYTYSTPYTDSKNIKQVFYAPESPSTNTNFSHSNKKLTHNLQKGIISEKDSFDSISSKDKHQQIMQDDVFGKPESSINSSKWVYIAQVKPKKNKGYFNEGFGKLPHKHDFGQTYENVSEVGLFIWDKLQKKVFQIEINKNLIPSSPSFLNEDGTQIVFHAYQRQNFGHGMVFCINRPIKIFSAHLQFIFKKQEDKKQESTNKNQKEDKTQIKVQTVQLFASDANRTKIFPKVSPCLKYLVYMSGTGNTHTFYKDLVIAKKVGQQWVESYRLNSIIIGYHSTLKNYIISQKGRLFVITQTLQRGSAQILKIDLQTGQLENLTQNFVNCTFQITNAYQNFVVGLVNSNNFGSFFYLNEDAIKVIQPQFKQDFVQKIYNEPIHSILLSVKQQDILPQYRDRRSKRPMVVIPHGGPHSSFINSLTCLRYVLLKMGYYLLHPNFSGSAGYGQQFLAASLGKIGIYDSGQIIDTVKKVLRDHPDIDTTRIHSQGGSFGGFLSAIFASRHSDIFRSVVISNGVLNLTANMWFSDIPEWAAEESLGTPLLHQLKLQDYQAMWKQSPTSQAMKIPILQFLGGKDRRVPWRQGLLLDAMTKANNVQITTYVYQNSGHSLSDSVQTITDVIIKTAEFFESFPSEKGNTIEPAQ